MRTPVFALCLVVFSLSLAPAPAQAQQPAAAYTLPPAAQAKWRAGRGLYGTGLVLGLIGNGLVLGGVITAAVGPQDIGADLVYAGGGAHAAGFVLSAAGLHLEHRALDEAGMPVGRGLFTSGTVLGAAGLLGTGAGYVLAATSLVPQGDRNTAVLATAISGSVLVLVSGLLYAIDDRHMLNRVYRLGTF